tara:strand:+ start:30 stop:497 length:468 start_codon:yes stop_codon:yes gene_type:complete
VVSTLKLTKIQIPNSDSDVISLDASTGNITLNKTLGGTSITVQGENTNTTNLQQGLIKVWMTLGVDAVQDDSFNCSSVDDDGTGDYGVHFTNAFNNALYSSSHMMTTTGLNPRMMIQSPSKAAGAVELRLLNANDGSANEGNITHTEMKICGDLA